MMLKNNKYFSIFQLLSLKTRVTLFTLSIIAVVFWALAFYSTQVLRDDMQQQLSEQQFSTVSYLATSVGEELNDRLIFLEIIAASITPAAVASAGTAQEFLEERTIFQTHFNGGTFVTRTDGIVMASTPLSPARPGTNVMDRDYMVNALQGGKAIIGKPVIGKDLLTPALPMAAPIRDAQGHVIGALVGLTKLDAPNFLDKIAQHHYGRTGGYQLVATQHRLIVTATDKRLVMSPIPTIGTDPMVDRFVQGYEGSGVSVNSVGVEVLVSAKGLPTAGWYAVASLPTAEAFAPIRAMQSRLLLISGLLTLVAGALTWWMLNRVLAPILSVAKTMTTLSAGGQSLQALPIARHDEIGQMSRSFTRIAESSVQATLDLIDSESRWKFAIEGYGDGLWDWDIASNTVFFSDRWKEMLGYSESDIGNNPQEWTTRIHPEDKAKTLSTLRDYLDGKILHYSSEQRVCCKDGSYRWTLSRGLVVSKDDATPLRMIGTHKDITKRKNSEKALQEKTEQLHTLSRRILETQETERRRVAHELHDEMGQALTAIKINLQLSARAQNHSSGELNTENLRIVDDALQQVRRLALALRPSMLDDLGLLPALRWMAGQCAERSGFSVQLDATLPGSRLAPEIETACFRIVQEALTNVTRHAQAQRVEIALHRTGDALMLSVHDDGCGFDLAGMRARAVAGNSIGVLGMQERAELIGGQIDIESIPGQGSTVRLRCPLRRRGEAT